MKSYIHSISRQLFHSEALKHKSVFTYVALALYFPLQFQHKTLYNGFQWYCIRMRSQHQFSIHQITHIHEQYVCLDSVYRSF